MPMQSRLSLRHPLRQFMASEHFRPLMRKYPWAQAYLTRRARRLRQDPNETGGTSEAAYCLFVWLHHLKFITRSFPDFRPGHILEIGPGDTVGVGLSALISGVQSYTGVDAHRYLNLDLTRRHAGELHDLLLDHQAQGKQPPLGEQALSPLPPDVLEPFLAAQTGTQDSAETYDAEQRLNYLSPVSPPRISAVLPEARFDLCMSQAVLEHVDAPDVAYRAMFRALKPGGVFSHEIDFRSHQTSYDWNGHWVYSERQWRIAQNDMTFTYINRLPLSAHLDLIRAAGFRILTVSPAKQVSDISRAHLAARWKDLSQEDLETAGAHVLAEKPDTAA